MSNPPGPQPPLPPGDRPPLPVPNLPPIDPARERMLREYEETQKARRKSKEKQTPSSKWTLVQILCLVLALAVEAGLFWCGKTMKERGYFSSVATELSRPPADSLTERLNAEFPLPEFKPFDQAAVDWDLFPSDMIPEFITVKKETEYSLWVNGQRIGSTREPAGHRAKFLNRNARGLVLTINDAQTLQALVPVFDTEVGDRLAGYYEAEKARIQRRIPANRAVAHEVLTRTAVSGDPRRQADGWFDPGAMVFQPVRAYLSDGRLPGRKLAQAKRWGWLGKQRYQDDNYDVVVVVFEFPTLFGQSSHVMKCLLQDRVVKTWVDPSQPPEPH